MSYTVRSENISNTFIDVGQSDDDDKEEASSTPVERVVDFVDRSEGGDEGRSQVANCDDDGGQLLKKNNTKKKKKARSHVENNECALSGVVEHKSKRSTPSPYMTSAIRPTGLNPYIHLSMLKANNQATNRKKATHEFESAESRGVSSSSLHQQQGARSQLLPALRSNNFDERKLVADPVVGSQHGGRRTLVESCPLQPLKNIASSEGISPHTVAPKATTASSAVKRLLKHFVSISRTAEDTCQTLFSESLLGREGIEGAEADRRRQLERLYAPSRSPPGIHQDSTNTKRAQQYLPRGASILGQVSTTHQRRTLGGLGHELVVVGLEEEGARQTWEVRLYGDLKAMYRACKRIATEIQLESDTRRLEEVKALRAAQEEREFIHRQSEATRQEHFGRQIRQLFLDESKIRFALEMEEYRSMTILQYSERENSTRAIANSQKKMDILRAEERTVFVFGLFQESFTEMERERMEELGALRAQYYEQGTALVLKYQSRARAEIEGREATVRDLRQIALRSTELHQLYLKSTEDRESILRDVVWEKERQARIPLETQIQNYGDDIRCSLEAVRDIVLDVVMEFLLDSSGVLSAIDLREAREDMVARLVREAIVSGEKASMVTLVPAAPLEVETTVSYCRVTTPPPTLKRSPEPLGGLPDVSVDGKMTANNLVSDAIESALISSTTCLVEEDTSPLRSLQEKENSSKSQPVTPSRRSPSSSEFEI